MYIFTPNADLLPLLNTQKHQLLDIYHVIAVSLKTKTPMVNKNIVGSLIEKSWKRVEKLLHQKGFKTIVLESDRALRKYIYSTIPDNVVVGLGTSLSTSALKIRDILLEKGNKVYYAWNGGNFNRSLDTFDEPPRPEYFLTNANSITPEGELINKEFSGKVAKERGFPKNIIAFSKPESLAKKFIKRSISSEFVLLDKKPESSDVTIALTAFA